MRLPECNSACPANRRKGTRGRRLRRIPVRCFGPVSWPQCPSAATPPRSPPDPGYSMRLRLARIATTIKLARMRAPTPIASSMSEYPCLNNDAVPSHPVHGRRVATGRRPHRAERVSVHLATNLGVCHLEPERRGTCDEGKMGRLLRRPPSPHSSTRERPGCCLQRSFR